MLNELYEDKEFYKKNNDEFVAAVMGEGTTYASLSQEQKDIIDDVRKTAKERISTATEYVESADAAVLNSLNSIYKRCAGSAVPIATGAFLSGVSSFTAAFFAGAFLAAGFFAGAFLAAGFFSAGVFSTIASTTSFAGAAISALSTAFAALLMLPFPTAIILQSPLLIPYILLHFCCSFYKQ